MRIFHWWENCFLRFFRIFFLPFCFLIWIKSRQTMSYLLSGPPSRICYIAGRMETFSFPLLCYDWFLLHMSLHCSPILECKPEMWFLWAAGHVLCLSLLVDKKCLSAFDKDTFWLMISDVFCMLVFLELELLLIFP